MNIYPTEILLYNLDCHCDAVFEMLDESCIQWLILVCESKNYMFSFSGYFPDDCGPLLQWLARPSLIVIMEELQDGSMHRFRLSGWNAMRLGTIVRCLPSRPIPKPLYISPPSSVLVKIQVLSVYPIIQVRMLLTMFLYTLCALTYKFKGCF